MAWHNRIIPLVMLASTGGTAADSAVRILDVTSLARELPRLAIVDARDASSYRKGHAPAAIHLPWDEWTQEEPSLWHRLFGDPTRWGKALDPGPELAGRLSALGLGPGKTPAVMGDPHAWGEEGRAAWNLLYWGFSEVVLVDGGYPAWAAAFPNRIERGRFRPTAAPAPPVLRRMAWRRIEAVEVRAAVDAGVKLFDVRTPEEFAGKPMTAQKRGGRIPGARLVALKDLYRPDGTFVDGPTLQKLAGGMPREARAIAYCVGGVRSALFAVLVEARLGISVANYDGSMWEWSADPTLPMEP